MQKRAAVVMGMMEMYMQNMCMHCCAHFSDVLSVIRKNNCPE